MNERLSQVFSPLEVRNVTLKNRVFSTGHMTCLPDGAVTDRLVAYHEARARGGAGLIVTEVATVHESAYFATHELRVGADDCIPGFRRLAEAVQTHGCKLFAQIFHPGRLVLESLDGSAPVAYAPSAVPEERFHTMPREMPPELIAEVVAAYGDAALRMKRAGLDGVEIVASHGYLPAQFLNPRLNHREDEYGGGFESRLRFTREVVSDVRGKVGDFVVGMRISGDEKEHDGLGIDEVVAACEALDSMADGLDYFSIVAGSSASLAGSVHIVPPMTLEAGYTAPYAAAVKARVGKPVFVAGRINQPQIAEEVLASGRADLCAMTRALICDPELPNKARAGRFDDIRACIGCNQACVGHMQLGYPVSCLQRPETGRELQYGARQAAERPLEVLVAGGGPGGMKAAAVAAERGHRVTLYERDARLGGQTLLAQLLPGRSEFGGVVTNLTREMELAGVEVVTKTEVTTELIAREAPDAVIVATGAVPYRPAIEGEEEAHVVDAWQVVRGEANVGASVVIADWRCDWIGLGLAEKLARDGCRVRLLANGNMAGESIQKYIRDQWLGELHKLGVEVTTLARLHGADADTAYFQHTTSGEPIVCEGMETLVLSLGHAAVDGLLRGLGDFSGRVIGVGDCLAPRTAEEAVLEGLKAGTAL